MLLIACVLTLASAALPVEDISAPGPSGELKCLWTKAANSAAPVVLIIPGSGPTDREGNSPLGVNAGSYRLLAEGLGANGVSTVRVDKRGMFASAGAAPDANAVTIDDYVDDTRAWLRSIRRTTGTDCVWLLGHSEGGLVALAAAQEGQDMCGLILVATAGRPLGDVLKEQLRGDPANAPFLPQADAAIDALAAGKQVDGVGLPPPLAPLFDPAIQGFCISAFSLDPVKLIDRIAKPSLIIQGERDLQVGMYDAESLKAAATSANLVRLPTANHVRKAVDPKDPSANIAAYADPALPLAPGVIDVIVEFLASHAAPIRP